MAALHRAVAFAQSHMVAEVVGKHLHFHVTRAQHEFFQIHAIVAECGTRLGASSLVLRLQVGRIVHFAHALAAAARRRLDQNRIAHGIGEFLRLGCRVDAAVRTRHRGNATRLHGLARHALVAHALDAFRRRADEHQVVVRASTREVGVFGQEAVAGMYGLRPSVFRGGDDVGHDQIAFVRLGGPYAHLFIGIAHRIGVLVFGGIHRDGFHAQLLARAHDAQRHLAAVGHQYLVKHYALSGPTASCEAWGSM